MNNTIKGTCLKRNFPTGSNIDTFTIQASLGLISSANLFTLECKGSESFRSIVLQNLRAIQIAIVGRTVFQAKIFIARVEAGIISPLQLDRIAGLQ